MARTTTPPLDAGDLFPALDLRFTDGTQRSLPGDRWTVVLIYRGEW